ncbi:MAG: hypothetical protein M0R80_23710 [Proteobacteria bacterium]|jgi:hypothetical protein|nr:hypothetical protein [Pseudomonadota bacterium]
MIQDYKVAKGTTLAELEAEVAELIRLGYQPFGMLIYSSFDGYCQPMVSH